MGITNLYSSESYTGKKQRHWERECSEDQPMDITNLYSSESHTGKKQRDWERECSEDQPMDITNLYSSESHRFFYVLYIKSQEGLQF